jgi:hypothetical protein
LRQLGYRADQARRGRCMRRHGGWHPSRTVCAARCPTWRHRQSPGDPWRAPSESAGFRPPDARGPETEVPIPRLHSMVK